MAYRERTGAGRRDAGVTRVTADIGAYDIHTRWGALDDLGALMRDAGLSGTAFIVTDSNVGPQFGERALAALHGRRLRGGDARLPGGRSEQEPRHRARDSTTGCSTTAPSAARPSSRSAAASSAISRASSRRRTCAACRSCSARRRCWRWSTRRSAARSASTTRAARTSIGAFYPPRLVVQDTSLLADAAVALAARRLRRGRSSTASSWTRRCSTSWSATRSACSASSRT